MRKNAVTEGLRAKPLGRLDFVLVVPRELRKGRGSRNISTIWHDVPFVSQKSDGQFIRRLHAMASSSGQAFRPSLLCESFPQSFAAVKTGHYAAVLPRIASNELSSKQFLVLDDPAFESLSRDLVLAWNPRVANIRPIALKLSESLKTLLSF